MKAQQTLKRTTVLAATLFFAMLGTTVTPATAGTVLYQRTFSDDGVVAVIPIVLPQTSFVTFESWGYAGGIVPTLPVSTTIPAGGFSPNLVLFDGTGAQFASDNGGHCGITAADPVTGTCNDPYLQMILGAGSYTAAVVEWDSVPVDGLLVDGFTQQGNAGFTCLEFGPTGNFCDVTTALGTVRNGNYALSVSADPVTVPEPAGSLLPIGLLAIGLLRKTAFASRKDNR